jgi:hypothetical protein
MRFMAERAAEEESHSTWDQQNQPILGNNTGDIEMDDRLPTYDETVQQAGDGLVIELEGKFVKNTPDDMDLDGKAEDQ